MSSCVAGATVVIGATSFSDCHAWGCRTAYASQFLDPIRRAWRTKAHVKALLIGDGGPEEWDLPLKSKRTRWATYEKSETKFDAAEGVLDGYCCLALARLIKRP